MCARACMCACVRARVRACEHVSFCSAPSDPSVPPPPAPEPHGPVASESVCRGQRCGNNYQTGTSGHLDDLFFKSSSNVFPSTYYTPQGFTLHQRLSCHTLTRRHSHSHAHARAHERTHTHTHTHTQARANTHTCHVSAGRRGMPSRVIPPCPSTRVTCVCGCVHECRT